MSTQHPESDPSKDAGDDETIDDATPADRQVEQERTTAAETAERQSPPGAEQTPVAGQEDTDNAGVDRGVILGDGVRSAALWSVRLLVIGVFVTAVLWLVGKLWVGVFPALMALILATALWPPTRWLRRHRFSPALAAMTTLLVGLAVVFGGLTAIAPSVVDQATELSDTAVQGVDRLQDWVQGPPLNIDSDQIGEYTTKVTDWIKSNGQRLASGAFSGLSTVTNGLVNFLLILVLSFFFIKDGPLFLPWLRRLVGRSAGRHITEVATRSWNTLGGFIQAQATVSAVDGILIGVGLLILGVPLALPLAILTFLGGFIPIIGAVSVGALSILVALVSNGPTTALLVLGLVLLVQQIEGNVLQPFLQGKSMQLHAGIILLAVTVGGTLFGIAGAFLSVPVTAILAVVIRYVSEQVNLRSGDLLAADVRVTTPEGEVAARKAQAAAATYLARHRTSGTPAEAIAPRSRTAAADTREDDGRTARPRTTGILGRLLGK